MRWDRLYVNNQVTFSDVVIDNDVLFALNSSIFEQLEKHDLISFVPFVLKFAIPTSDEVPWALTKQKQTTNLSKSIC